MSLLNRPNPKSKTKDIHIKPSLYEDEAVIANFKKLCAQDSLPYIEAFKEMVGPWFVKHHLDLGGNPQRQLLSFDREQPLDLGRCGYAGCKEKAVIVGTYKPQSKEYKLCKLHLVLAKNNSRDWSLKETKEMLNGEKKQ